MESKIEKIINSIKFKYVQQDDIANDNYYYRFKKYLSYIYGIVRYQELRHFTFYENTKVNFDNYKFQNFSKKMKSIEGMSTIANAWIINQIASTLNENQNYVNIGCWKGFSLIAGMINTKCSVFGVDNFAWKEQGKKEFYKNFNKNADTQKHHFYEGEYLKFLEDWEKSKKFIDFYFYDGPHSFKDQYESLEIGSTFFRSGTIILVDDTNWEEPREATMQFINKRNSNYKLLSDLKCSHARHPTYWNGLIIFQKL